MKTPTLRKSNWRTNKITKPRTFADLETMGACADAVAFCKQFKSLHHAWDCCRNPSWLTWLIRELFSYYHNVGMYSRIERTRNSFEKRWKKKVKKEQTIDSISDPDQLEFYRNVWDRYQCEAIRKVVPSTLVIAGKKPVNR